MSTGGPAVYLVRLNAPRPGWQERLKRCMPKVAHHCLCVYLLSLDTPRVQMRSYTSGVLVHSVFCRHVDGTQAMEHNERERYTTMLLVEWIAKMALCIPQRGGMSCPWAVLNSYQTQDGKDLFLRNTQPRTYTRQTPKRKTESSESKWQSTCSKEHNNEYRRALP